MTFFGYTNCAYYNRRPEGDTSWFASREERDAHLEQLRETATGHGLAASAARAGIYPVKRTLRGERAEAFRESHLG